DDRPGLRDLAPGGAQPARDALRAVPRAGEPPDGGDLEPGVGLPAPERGWPGLPAGPGGGAGGALMRTRRPCEADRVADCVKTRASYRTRCAPSPRGI